MNMKNLDFNGIFSPKIVNRKKNIFILQMNHSWIIQKCFMNWAQIIENENENQIHALFRINCNKKNLQR